MSTHSSLLALTSFVAMMVATAAAASPDPLQTDGDKYKAVLENACVRVLEYHDRPGATTQLHTHPAFVLYALAPFKRTLALPDGKVLSREFKTGDLMWSPAQTHIGHNVGETPTHVLIVELKPGASADACGAH